MSSSPVSTHPKFHQLETLPFVPWFQWQWVEDREAHLAQLWSPEAQKPSSYLPEDYSNQHNGVMGVMRRGNIWFLLFEKTKREMVNCGPLCGQKRLSAWKGTIVCHLWYGCNVGGNKIPKCQSRLNQPRFAQSEEDSLTGHQGKSQSSSDGSFWGYRHST